MKEYLRAAAESDMDLLFVWANEQAVRSNSFSTEKIPYEQHKKWFADVLNREDCKQYIYMQDDQAIGQIRITADGETGEIGYSICAEQRGMGHGRKILQLVCERIKKDFPQIKKITAKVKPNNTASQKAFKSAGFEEKYYTYEVMIDR